ncbi:MAG TPA: hypothetical protein VK028_06440, partial [Micromonosporaceae bacterium]|nr:hypothetical protein [Micromonosporaceae bacterium]
DVTVRLTQQRYFDHDLVCDFKGGTDETIKPADGTTQLGIETPGQDYPANAGPFRNASGQPIVFQCGQTSLCFQPATVTESLTEVLTVALGFRQYVEEKEACPGIAVGGGAPSVTLTVPVGERRCIAPYHDDWGYGSFKINFCASNNRVNQPIPLTLQNLACESTYSTYYCDVAFRGGLPPIQIRWVVNGAARPTFDNNNSISGPCTVGRPVSVRVTVSDATGASFSTSRSVYCRTVPL